RFGEAVGVRPESLVAVEAVDEHLLKARTEVAFALRRADVGDDDREIGFGTDPVVRLVRRHPHGERLIGALPRRNRSSGGGGGRGRVVLVVRVLRGRIPWTTRPGRTRGSTAPGGARGRRVGGRIGRRRGGGGRHL